MRFRSTVLLAFALLLPHPALARAAQSACNGWDSTFAAPGPDLPFEDFVAFDDGSGLALYAAGQFRAIGRDPIQGVARWNGAHWTQVGAGLPLVQRITVFDDGSGPKLYAAGKFRIADGAPANTVARWNGSSWTALTGAGPTGASDLINALAVFDDGSGPALYLAGRITLASSSTIQRVVRWRSGTWSATSAGIPTSGGLPSSFATFNDGSGSKLYVGIATSAPTSSVLSWNGASWVAPAASLVNADVEALATYTSAAGTALYATGTFTTSGGANNDCIARYDGTSWSALGTGLSPGPTADFTIGKALVVHDDGTGSRLYVGGGFSQAGGLPARDLASWDGSTWRAVHPDLGFGGSPNVIALASFDDGHGRGLFVGGNFMNGGRTAAANAALWRQGIWTRFARGEGIAGQVITLARLDDGSGPALYMSGNTSTAGMTVTNRIARWNGTRWSALGDPFGSDSAANALIEFENGATHAIIAAGTFTEIGGVPAQSIASWNGASWSELGNGLHNPVDVAYATCLAVFDDGTGSALYVGGQFKDAGGVPASNIARWNGTSWSALGSGTNFLVRDLAAFDDGSGEALYACGIFTVAGGLSVPRIARWNGTAWSAVGNDITSAGQLLDLALYDDGTGSELYLVGDVFLQGSTTLVHVLRWNGAHWTVAGTPPTGTIGALTVFDAGAGPRLCAPVLNGASSTIWTWDGATWSALPGDFEGYAGPLATFDAEHDGVPDLYVGGYFRSAGGATNENIARFVSCGTQGTLVCAGDGTGTACPCGNSGGLGHGCANSVDAQGAVLTNAGLASLSADTLSLSSHGLTGAFAFFAQGTSIPGGAGVPFGDGLKCVGGAVKRLGSVPIVSSGASLPQSGATSLSQLGHITAPGQVRYYQVLYRNLAAFCTPETTNATNGLRVTWTL